MTQSFNSPINLSGLVCSSDDDGEMPRQAALVARKCLHYLPELATNDCHQIVTDVSQSRETQLCSDAN